ncbi:MAG: RHS repeat-associated core domain-containing protein [Acidobacteriota bacterium]
MGGGGTSNLDRKVWEGTATSYEYNHSNQLKKVDSGDETVEYFYDDGKGRVNRVVSTKGWSRKGIDYNDFGSAKTEIVNPGGDLMTWYSYDDRGLRFKTVRLPQTQHGTLHLTYPNGGEVLQGGEVCTITWDPVPAGVEYLKIEWRQGGGDWQQIPGGEQWVASVGAFPWDLPIPAQDLTQCFVRIVNVDAPTQWDRSDTSFTIKAQQQPPELPKLQLAEPTAEDRWQVSTEHNIKWTATGDFKSMDVKLEYWSKANGWKPIAGGLNPKDGAYPWTVLDDANAACQIWIHTGNGTVEATSATFAVVPLERKITVTWPTGWEGDDPETSRLESLVLFAGEPRQITIDYDKITYGKGVEVSLVIAGVVKWTRLLDQYKTVVDWTVDDVESPECKIVVKDRSSAAEGRTERNFVIHEYDPTIDLQFPDGGNTLAVNQPCEIRWVSTKAARVPLVRIELGVRVAPKLIEWNEETPIAVVENKEGVNLYSWTPTEPGTNLVVRVRDDRDYKPQDFTHSSFTVIEEQTQIVVDVPNGPEHNMVVGTKRYIKWATTGPNRPDQVVIKLTRTGSMGDATKIHEEITVANTGSYPWVVTGAPSDHCLIWVGAPNGIPCDTSDKEFRILQDVVVSKPQAGEYEMGSFMEIRWTPRNWPKNVKVELQRDGGQLESLTAPDTSIANEGKMTWKVTGSASQNCYIRVSDAKDGKPFGDSAKFAIVPSVRVLYPNGGEQLMVGKTVKLEWETRGAVPEVRLELSRNRGTTWELIDGRTKVPNDGKYAWTVKGTKTSNNCLFRVSDLDGKPTDTSDNLFAIRTVGTAGAAGPGTQAGVDMLVGDEMEQQPGALPWSKPWLEDLPAGTVYIPGADGMADRLLQVPEDDGEYVGTEEDFERDFGGVVEPPPPGTGGDTPPSGDPGEGGEPELAGPPFPAGSEITYYIYSFDGRLLAEYDSDGYCNRDYIYAGNRLIAEYKPKVGIYHFYTPDQINTTRMITDQAGKILYSAGFGPYGNEQITWVDKCSPALKFSGKERDRDTGFDYYGARYFASTQHRWISPDPVRTQDAAVATPQMWNLYSYVANNPISLTDPDGRVIELKYDPAQRAAQLRFIRSVLGNKGQHVTDVWKNGEWILSVTGMGRKDFAKFGVAELALAHLMRSSGTFKLELGRSRETVLNDGGAFLADKKGGGTIYMDPVEWNWYGGYHQSPQDRFVHEMGHALMEVVADPSYWRLGSSKAGLLFRPRELYGMAAENAYLAQTNRRRPYYDRPTDYERPQSGTEEIPQW